MLQTFKNGQGSIVLRVKLLNSSVATGAGLTGLTSASAGLIISTIADNEATATAYTVTGATIEAVTTKGTYAAPTATKCRFIEVDATNHPGIYELQFADARFAVANSKSLLVSLSGATNLAQADFVVQLQTDDPFVAKISSGTGAGQLSVSSGLVTLAGVTHTGAVIPTVTTLTGHTAQTGDAFARLGAPAGASVSADVAAVKVDTAAILVDTAEIGAAGAGLTGVALSAAGLTAVRDKVEVKTVLTFTVGTGSTTANLVVSAITPATTDADQLKGRVIIFDNDTTTAALRGQAAAIVSHTLGATPTFTLATGAWTTAPLTGNTGRIV